MQKEKADGHPGREASAAWKNMVRVYIHAEDMQKRTFETLIRWKLKAMKEKDESRKKSNF